MPDPAADETADALLSAFGWLAEHLLNGWGRTHGRILAAVTGLPAPPLNGVWVADPQPESSALAPLVAEVEARGMPWMLQSPLGAETVEVFARDRGMIADEVVPLMRLDSPARTHAPEGLVVRRLDAKDARLHADIAARGYPAPPGFFDPLTSAELAGSGAISYFLGEVRGEPVTTALGLMQGDHVGIFDVATLSEHRGLGYGAAVTSAVVDDARQRDARWAWLQSSPEGFGVYTKLGFRTVSEWQCWVSA